MLGTTVSHYTHTNCVNIRNLWVDAVYTVSSEQVLNKYSLDKYFNILDN